MLIRVGRLIRAAGRDIVVLWHACRHPGTPRIVKLAALLCALYVLSPIDIFPDWMVLFGWTDDVALLALALPMLLNLIPEPILAQARAAASGARS